MKIKNGSFNYTKKDTGKMNGTKLLNTYNSFLKENFGIVEPFTNANKGMIKKFKELFEQTYELDFTKFIEDIICNWQDYQKEFFSASGYPYPALKYIYANMGALTLIYNKRQITKEEEKEIEEW